MNRSLSPLSFAFLFAGSFLGAGFLSGRELWQFFGVFGKPGIAGFAVSLALFFSFSAALLLRAENSGEEDPAVLFSGEDGGWRRTSFRILEAIFLLGIFFVMTAGAAALLGSFFRLPKALGAGVFALVCTLCARKGAEAVAKALSFSVPLLLLAAFLVFVRFLRAGDLFSLDLSALAEAPGPLANPFLSALLYASFNYFGAAAILLPFAKLPRRRRSLLSGAAAGSLMLLFCGLFVLLPLFACAPAAGSALPMLALCESLHPLLGSVFALLLLLGMFGAALTRVFALLKLCERLHGGRRPKPAAPVLLLTAAAAAAGSFGFERLVALLYPLFGVLGLFAFLCFLTSGRKRCAPRPLRRGLSRKNAAQP